MKKIIILLLIIPSSLFCQINDNLSSVYLEIKETTDGWLDVFPNLIPIGWSDDGKFAYKITMCDDMCGCCTDGVSIINTITDKQVQYLDFGEGGGQFGEISKNDSIMEVRKTLKRNNIIIGSSGKFIKSNKINNYNIILNQERIKSNSEWGYGIEYNLIVGNYDGYKTVSKGIIEDNEIDLQYLGYFKSPFENRIIILFSSCYRGIEQTDYYSLKFVGCSLNPKTF